MKLRNVLLGGGALLLLLGARSARAAAPSSPGAGGADEVARRAFVAELDAAVRRVAGSYSRAARVMVIAQAAFESGWGRTRMYREGFNPFNVIRASSDPGQVIVSGDQECKPDGTCRPITQRFAKYGSLDEAVGAYLRLLGAPRYKDALTKLERADVEEFITTLYAGGYFTLPVQKYLASFKDMIRSVEKRLV